MKQVLLFIFICALIGSVFAYECVDPNTLTDDELDAVLIEECEAKNTYLDPNGCVDHYTWKGWNLGCQPVLKVSGSPCAGAGLCPYPFFCDIDRGVCNSQGTCQLEPCDDPYSCTNAIDTENYVERTDLPPACHYTSLPKAVFIPTAKRACSIEDATIKQIISQEYAERTQSERKFTPTLPASLYDDITFAIIFPEDCTDFFTNTQVLEKTWSGPDSISMKMRGKVLEQRFKIGETMVDDRDGHTYFVTWSGWPNGVVSAEHMEKLIDDVLYQQKPTFEFTQEFITVDTSLNKHTNVGKKETEIPLTNCVQVTGGGPIKIVNVRGEGIEFSAGTLLSKVKELTSNSGGFQTIQPLKTLSEVNRFSHFLDLTTNPELSTLNAYIYPKIIPKTCGEADVTTVYVDKTKVAAKFSMRIMESNIRFKKSTHFHEFGHVFGHLDDEYLYSRSERKNKDAYRDELMAYVNCKADENDFYMGEGHKGCSFKDLYRPTSHSLMRYDYKSSQYNMEGCVAIYARGMAVLEPEALEFCQSIDGIELS